jgi:hypothetical protein
MEMQLIYGIMFIYLNKLLSRAFMTINKKFLEALMASMLMTVKGVQAKAPASFSKAKSLLYKKKIRVEAIKQDHRVHCVWSHVALKQKYDIDHCLPFARWPNNDLWNLLPTTTKVNQSKKDRIPKSIRFTEAKDDILQWWGEAWDDDYHQRFFTEANISLPVLTSNNESLDDIFEALKMQSIRVAEMQQLSRW